MSAGSTGRGFVPAGGLGRVRLLLGGVGGLGGVLGRAVDGVEHQGLIPGVAEVVPGPGRDRALVTGLDLMRVPVQVGFPGAGDEGEDLIGVLVDRPTRSDRCHNHPYRW